MQNPNTFSIFTGDAKTIFMRAVQGDCTGDPLDLTGVVEIDIALPNADGTFAHLTLTGSQVVVATPAVLGKFSGAISSAVSALLQPGELQNINVTFTFGDDPFTVPFIQALSVFEGS